MQKQSHVTLVSKRRLVNLAREININGKFQLDKAKEDDLTFSHTRFDHMFANCTTWTCKRRHI